MGAARRRGSASRPQRPGREPGGREERAAPEERRTPPRSAAQQPEAAEGRYEFTLEEILAEFSDK